MSDSQQSPQSPKQQQQQPPAPSAWDWRLLAWVLLLVLFGMYWLEGQQTGAVERVPYSEFKQAVRDDRVAEVTIKGQQIRGRYRQTDAAGQEPQPARFTTVKPSMDDPDLMPLLEDNGVTIHAETTELSWWLRALVSLLPWVLLIGLIFYTTKKMQERMSAGGSGGLFGMGKSRARRFQKEESSTAMADVAGLENAKAELQEIVDYLREPQRYRALGAKIPRGLLLTGPPGTGKTLLARAVAGEAEVPFFSISASEFIEMFVGVGASRVRDMFETAKREAPSIIFIDEIDAIGRSRGSGLGGGHDEREQTLNQILSEMDGFSPHEAVIVMAATNRPDVLDSALLRPGRFDRKVTLERPGREARQQILAVHTREVPLADDVDLTSLAQGTAGFSGADLENLVNEAALLAGRKRQQKVDRQTFEEARDKVIMGSPRETVLDDQEKERIAYHESGHALLGLLLPNADPVRKVTVIPRGHALGATEQIPVEERYNLRKSYLLDRIAGALGGRVAEKIVYDEVSSGAAQDLEMVTKMARHMVCQWGMNDELGPVYYKHGEEHVFLGRELAQPRDFSEHTAQLIDEEVRKVIHAMEDRAEGLLTDNRAKLDALAKALLDHETLTADEIKQVLGKVDAESTDGAAKAAF